MNVVTADEALKLALGSTVISLWVIFFVITVVVSPVGLYLKISVFLDLRKTRVQEFGVELSDAYTSKHRKLLNKAAVAIRLIYAKVIAGLLEDLPFSILGTYFVFKSSELGTQLSVMAMLSTISSSIMLGVKLCSLPSLKALLVHASICHSCTFDSCILTALHVLQDEESRQKHKLARGVLGESVQELKEWLSRIDQLKPYRERFEAAKVTGRAMLAITSEAELSSCGVSIDTEVDKYCLLLNLARVRAHTLATEQPCKEPRPVVRGKVKKPLLERGAEPASVEMEQVSKTGAGHLPQLGVC